MEGRTSVGAVPGQGLEGDRYASGTGRFSSRRARGREVTDVTLIAALFGLVLTPERARRNIVTQGVRLGDLIGRRFRIGQVVLEGAAFCEPCRSITTSRNPRLLQALSVQGGLRARLVSKGVISVGDRVVVDPCP